MRIFDLQVLTRFLEGEMTMRNFDLSPLMRQWIGFDKLAQRTAKRR